MENQQLDTETTDWNDATVKPNTFSDFKIKRFEMEKGKRYQITLQESPPPQRRCRHYGRIYEARPKENPEALTDQDRAAGAVVLPDQKTGKKTVYRPQADKKGQWQYLRCLKHLGICVVCVSEKVNLKKDDKKKIQESREAFLSNIILWKTDAGGNLLGKQTGRPIDAHGRFIKLEFNDSDRPDFGEWDMETFEHDYENNPSAPRDEPTGEVSFYVFGADKFVQIRQGARINKKKGPLGRLNFFIEPDGDAQFRKAKITAIPHEDSAANLMPDWVLKQFEDKGLKKRGNWIAREHTNKELVYLFGLEAKLLNDLPDEKERAEDGDEEQEPQDAGPSQDEIERREKDLQGNLEDGDDTPAADVSGALDKAYAEGSRYESGNAGVDDL